MSGKRVLILGASRYYSRSIQAAREAGYFVIAADRDPRAEGFAAADLAIVCDIVDRAAVLRVAQEQRISAVVPVNDYGVPTSAYVAARMGLPGITAEAAHLATDKSAMRARWLETGVPCPLLAHATSMEEFHRAVEIVGLPCVLKPAHGIGGASRGVIVVQAIEELPEAVDFAQRFYPEKATLVEQFVRAEQEHSAEVIIADGTPRVIAIADKVKTPLPYRVDKSVLYPTSADAERRAQLNAVVVAAVRAIGLSVGAAHVELASTRDGCILFELGARCGGGGTPEPVVRFATGIDEFVETVRVLAGDPPVRLQPAVDRGCVYHFLTPAPGRVRAVRGVEKVRSVPGILDVEVFVRPGDQIRPVRIGLDRAGFVIAGAETREGALVLARQAEQSIVFDYEEEPTGSSASGT